jgi:hypothetical protein
MAAMTDRRAIRVLLSTKIAKMLAIFKRPEDCVLHLLLPLATPSRTE